MGALEVCHEEQERLRRVIAELQARNDRQYKEITRLYGLTKRNDMLQVELKEWKDALQELYDWQNGPPLIRDAEHWQKAMDEASRLLTKP